MNPASTFMYRITKKYRECITEKGIMTISLLPTLSGFTYAENWRVTENVIFCTSKLWVQLWACIFNLCWPRLSQAMPWHSSAVRIFQGPVWLWNWVQLSQFSEPKSLLAHLCPTLCQLLSLVSRNHTLNLLVKTMAMCSKQLNHMLFWSLSWLKQPDWDFGMAWESVKGPWFHSRTGWKNKLLSETRAHTPGWGNQDSFHSELLHSEPPMAYLLMSFKYQFYMDTLCIWDELYW